MAEFLGTNTEGGNENKSFMHSTYDDNKLSKSKELNARMSIESTAADEYTNKLKNIKGGE